MSSTAPSVHSDTTSTFTANSSSTDTMTQQILHKFSDTCDLPKPSQMLSKPPPSAYTTTPVVPGSYLNSPTPTSTLLLHFPDLPPTSLPLATAVNKRVRKYMSKYDSSHDYEHIQRVVANAARIWNSDPQFKEYMDPLVVFLACMMHDIGDHKYLRPWQSGAKIKMRMLLRCGVEPSLAQRVTIIASHVSYTFESKHPDKVAATLASHPELAIVQDADRLDALGPVGQARCFAYHGVSSLFRRKSLNVAVRHMWEKLWRLPGLMKTEFGREEGMRLWEWHVRFQKEWEGQVRLGDVVRIGGVEGKGKGEESGEESDQEAAPRF